MHYLRKDGKDVQGRHEEQVSYKGNTYSQAGPAGLGSVHSGGRSLFREDRLTEIAHEEKCVGCCPFLSIRYALSDDIILCKQGASGTSAGSN